MKKILVVLCVAGFIVSLASPLMAGGIVNKQNLSAEYLRTFSRNAATDAADATVFNPAGVMKMENGCYGNLGLFHATKKYNNEFGGTDYDSNEPSIVPGLFLLHKEDKWAGFFALTIPGGGGLVDYKNGSARTVLLSLTYLGGAPSSLEAESVYKGYTIGGAYAVNDMVSVAGGLRYVDAFFDISAEFYPGGPPVPVAYEETADGWGGFFGVNYTPREDLNFGFRFETATKLDFEMDVTKADPLLVPLLPTIGIVDGSKKREDLPGLIGLGAAYTVNPNLKLDLSLTYYMEKSAKWEGSNSWDLAIAAEYTFNPQLRASAGYMLTKTGIDADEMLPENPELGANSLCAGVAWEPKENMTLNFAILNTFYDSDTDSNGVKYEKNVFGLGFGIEYKFK